MKGLRSFTERKALHSPELSWGAHITTLGLGVFLLLLLALYSANLVAILVAETTGSAFRDIEDVVKSGATACALEVSSPTSAFCSLNCSGCTDSGNTKPACPLPPLGGWSSHYLMAFRMNKTSVRYCSIRHNCLIY